MVLQTKSLANNSRLEPETLMARWRLPSLTIHKIVTSGSSQGSVIPHKAKAVLSMRIVPDQTLSQIITTFKSTLQEKFNSFQSDNTLSVVVEHKADWWLGDPENRGFKSLEKAVREEWGMEPLYIREVRLPPLSPLSTIFFIFWVMFNFWRCIGCLL